MGPVAFKPPHRDQMCQFWRGIKVDTDIMSYVDNVNY